jgi:predicted enzyme related to lactoylglutathione lyase
MFSWADLATPDRQGSVKFYTEILELEATEVPVSESMVYVILSKGSKNACAMFQMSEQMKQQFGGHPAWTSYFTVKSADDAADRARSLGGALVQEPFDVFDSGRMAVIKDPTGAVFAVWEPRKDIGAHVFGEPGALGWTELYTYDTGAASEFYAGLFGWSVGLGPSADGEEYSVFQMDGTPAAGMMAIKKEWGEMPPNWSIYFVVASLDDTIEKAKGMGARQVMPPTDAEGVGRFVYLQDPQGTYVAFIQLEQRPA